MQAMILRLGCLWKILFIASARLHSGFPIMHLRRIIVTFYLLLFLSVGAGSSVFFWQTRQEYNQLKSVEASTQRRLNEAEQRLSEQESTLKKLRTDPDYVAMIIRKRLGYAKPDEFVFRFEADQ